MIFKVFLNDTFFLFFINIYIKYKIYTQYTKIYTKYIYKNININSYNRFQIPITVKS